MSKKHQNDEPIALDKALSKSEAFVIKHKNRIIAAIVFIIAFVAGLTIYMNIADANENAAKDENLKSYNAATESEKLDGLLNVAKEHDGTDAANLANAEIGFIYAKEGNYEEAIKHLEKFESGDNIFKAAVLGALGNCYAAVNNPKAIETLQEAADMANEPILTSTYLYTIATLYEAQGNKAEANKAYQNVVDKYKNESLQALTSDTYQKVQQNVYLSEMGAIRTK